MLEAVEEMVEMLEPSLLPVDKLGAMCDKLTGLLADSSKRRAERLKRLEGEDFDEDEALAIEVLPLGVWPLRARHNAITRPDDFMARSRTPYRRLTHAQFCIHVHSCISFVEILKGAEASAFWNW